MSDNLHVNQFMYVALKGLKLLSFCMTEEEHRLG